MSEFDQPEVPVSDYGRQRRAAWLAGLQANADMASSAAMAAHGQSDDRSVTQAGQAGLFGHMTAQDKAAAVAARPATVGSAYGGRPLERLGGTLDHGAVGCAPAPARVDLRYVDQFGQRPTGESPLAAWMRAGQQ